MTQSHGDADRYELTQHRWTADEVPLPDGVSTDRVKAEAVRPAAAVDELNVLHPAVGKTRVVELRDDGSTFWVLDIPEQVYRFAGFAASDFKAEVTEYIGEPAANPALPRNPPGPEVEVTVEHPACGGQAVLHRVLRRDGYVRYVERLLGCWQLEPGDEVSVELKRV